MSENNKPLKKLSANGISVSLWENTVQVQGQNRTLLRSTLQRNYRDKDGKWQTSKGLSKAHVAVAIQLLSRMFCIMTEEEASLNSKAQTQTEVIDEAFEEVVM